MIEPISNGSWLVLYVKHNCEKKVHQRELKRIIRATYIEGYPPRIELHGFTFLLELED